jgi:drug/metabolite transporter (DMT)-like permease
MLGLLYSLVSSLSYGAGYVVSKKIIKDNGLYRALVYACIGFTILLLLGAIIFEVPLVFPEELYLPYFVQIFCGALGVLALFKAFEHGKASIMASLSTVYVVIVFGIAIFFFNEPFSPLQIVGTFIILLSSLLIAFKNLKKHKLENGVLFLIATIFGWGYYYSFIKIFIPVLGVYGTTFFLEIGIGVLIMLYAVITKKNLRIPTFSESLGIGLRSCLIFLGSMFYTFSVALIGVGLTSAFTSSSSIFTDILSYFFLKEKLTPGKYLAMLSLIVGLVLVFLG